MSTFFKPLAWALPIVMLLAGCNGSDKDADKDATKPEPHTTSKKLTSVPCRQSRALTCKAGLPHGAAPVSGSRPTPIGAACAAMPLP